MTEIYLLVCVCVHSVCVHVFVTPLQSNRLEAVPGRQGCHGDQRSQRWATSVVCFSRQAFLVAASSSVASSASVINVAFQTRHLNRFWNRFNSFIASSAASAQSCSQQSLSLWQSAGTPGFRPWKAGEPGAAFNPCPLPALSLHGFPLYMDMFCLNSSFLLAALSAAQRGTHSLFIGTYLGKGRNPVFLSNP